MRDRDHRSVGLKSVGILAFDDVEVLDLCGPFQVFDSVRPVDQHDDAARLFNVIVVAEELKTVRCRGGLQTMILSHPKDHDNRSFSSSSALAASARAPAWERLAGAESTPDSSEATCSSPNS